MKRLVVVVLFALASLETHALAACCGAGYYTDINSDLNWLNFWLYPDAGVQPSDCRHTSYTCCALSGYVDIYWLDTDPNPDLPTCLWTQAEAEDFLSEWQLAIDTVLSEYSPDCDVVNDSNHAYCTGNYKYFVRCDVSRSCWSTCR